ncbi:hypothetical protein BVI434_300002 [Burkholderia vietnamiensis]|nr:hypothetical protein BVI434_300002 [Burkholderia vietnamiensis]
MGALSRPAVASLRAAGADARHGRARRGERDADLAGVEPQRDPVGHHRRMRGARVAHAHSSAVAARGGRVDRAHRHRPVKGGRPPRRRR